MFSKENKKQIRTAINLIGVFLIHLPSRPLLYLGNLAVYVPSYTTLHRNQVTISAAKLSAVEEGMRKRSESSNSSLTAAILTANVSTLSGRLVMPSYTTQRDKNMTMPTSVAKRGIERGGKGGGGGGHESTSAPIQTASAVILAAHNSIPLGTKSTQQALRTATPEARPSVNTPPPLSPSSSSPPTTTVTATSRERITKRTKEVSSSGAIAPMITSTTTATTATTATTTTTEATAPQSATPSPSQSHGVQESWYLPVYSCSWMLGTFLCGLLSKSDSMNACVIKLVIALGIIMQSGSFILGSYAIQIPNISDNLFLVLLLIGLGFGAGLYEGILLNHYVADRVAQHSLGATMSIILSASPVGGVVINQFVTLLTNPDNVSPDLKVGEVMIFSQKEIRQRIPTMFLVLGVVMLSLTSVGFFMLQEKCVEEDEENEKEEENKKHPEITVVALPPESLSFISDDQIINTRTTTDVRSNVLHENETIPSKDYGALATTTHTIIEKILISDTIDEKHLIENFDSDSEQPETEKDSMRSKDRGCSSCTVSSDYEQQALKSLSITDDPNNQTPISVSPRDMTKCCNFYKLAAVYFCGSSARLFLNVYYKVYGQVWIHDDYFLTMIGTSMSFLSIFSSVIWGVILDRIGIKHCFISLYGGISVFFLLMYAFARLNKWAYFLVTLINSSFVNYLYPIFTISLIKWFGKNDLSTKLGMVESFSLAGYILASFVIDSLMDSFGFFSGFSWTSAVHFVGLLVVVFAFPRL